MRNTYKIVWTDEALNGLKDIIDYLERKFSEKDVAKFAKKLDKQIEIIKNNPETFSLSAKSGQIRRALVAKLTSIYYRIDGDIITIVTVYDNRKNPEDLKI